MNSTDPATVLAGARLLPVLTVPSTATAGPPADALTAGGARCAEVTFRTPDGIDAHRMAAYLADPAVLAVGGSWMASPAHLERGDSEDIRRLTTEAVERSVT